MTMRILVPEDISGAKIVSNISDAEAVADYDPAATYSPGDPGDRAVEGDMVYEAVQEVTGVAPSVGVNEDPPAWIEVRTVNPLAMWNGVIGDSTTGAEPWAAHSGSGIQMEIQPGRVVSGLTLFGLQSAEYVRVELIDSQGSTVYDQTINLRSTLGISGYWSYWFTPVQRMRDVIFDGLPAYSGTIRISIQQAGSSPAECGVCVVGAVSSIGCLQYQSGGGVMSFSKKRRDSFGRLLIKKGDNAKTFSYQFSVDKNESDAAARLLTDLDATRVVFIGTDQFETSLVYGIYEDLRFTYSNFAFHNYTLEAVGLT